MKCIYCLQDKDENEFSLEHILPQFLGGASAPQILKTRSVCKRCNNNLGLFVDASVAKNFLVFGYLNSIHRTYYDPEKDIGLPLQCMGECDLKPPFMDDSEVCESWLGPFGEQIYWIRPKDEHLYSYMGGNPRTAKEVTTRAYFFISENTNRNPTVMWHSFANAFKGTKVKKIFCAIVDGADPKNIGFSEPNDMDLLRKEYFRDVFKRQEMRHIQQAWNIKWDVRFLAKTAIALASVFVGESVFETQYFRNLNKALWDVDNKENGLIKGKAFLNEPDDVLKKFLSEKDAVVLTLQQIRGNLSFSLSISDALTSTVLVAENIEYNEAIGEGLVYIFYPPLQKCIELTFPEFLAYKLGEHENLEIQSIQSLGNKYDQVTLLPVCSYD